jgi:alpha-galactosidase
VYFDHDFDKLVSLAERAATAGVERFVLDDGWFGGRRDDTSSLGDWWVSPDAHPQGLAPLIDRVRSLGMEFGIWVEPEMVNPDSELYRAHPDWALADLGYTPVLGRNQLVLDLTIPAAFDEILSRLDTLLGDHEIGFVKWDMNRDHVQATGIDGRAGTHEQTLALYRLLDELRRRHPDVEFESCSSGGARIDLGILQRAERVWTSDCNDALERQTIQRHASMLVPLEVLGAHVGPPTAHTTGRTQSLAFRAATALFGHFGIEWNLLTLGDDELAALTAWVELYKRHRDLLHGGDVVRIDHDDPHAYVHGVLATDRRSGLIAYVQLTSAQALLPRPVRIPELDSDRRYRVVLVPQPGAPAGRRLTREIMAVETGLELTGRQLAAHGVRLPVVHPESIELLWIEAP